VHEPTEAQARAWSQATASVYDETRSYLGGSWVAEILQFRRDWDAGKNARHEAAYAERFAHIDLPVEAMLRHFR
jgi:hypothetical protein